LGQDLVLVWTAELEAANSPRGIRSGVEDEEDDSVWNGSPQGSKDGGMLSLSPVEQKMFAWMGRGVHDIHKIAGRLFRSVNTVRMQLSRIYDKLAVQSKAELLALVVQNWLDFLSRSHPLQRAAGTCDCLVGGAGIVG
jgi:DNA-binding CsgD family transcriptional regulator